jgi:hypothetical protein
MQTEWKKVTQVRQAKFTDDRLRLLEANTIPGGLAGTAMRGMRWTESLSSLPPPALKRTDRLSGGEAPRSPPSLSLRTAAAGAQHSTRHRPRDSMAFTYIHTCMHSSQRIKNSANGASWAPS